MKKILLAVILVFWLMLQRADAQSRVTVHLNSGSRQHYAYGYHHRYYHHRRPVVHYYHHPYYRHHTTVIYRKTRRY